MRTGARRLQDHDLAGELSLVFREVRFGRRLHVNDVRGDRAFRRRRVPARHADKRRRLRRQQVDREAIDRPALAEREALDVNVLESPLVELLHRPVGGRLIAGRARSRAGRSPRTATSACPSPATASSPRRESSRWWRCRRPEPCALSVRVMRESEDVRKRERARGHGVDIVRHTYPVSLISLSACLAARPFEAAPDRVRARSDVERHSVQAVVELLDEQSGFHSGEQGRRRRGHHPRSALGLLQPREQPHLIVVRQ